PSRARRHRGRRSAPGQRRAPGVLGWHSAVVDAQGVRPARLPRGPAGSGGVEAGTVGGGMAPAIDRRGSDDRRSPLLAAPKAGRERGGTEVPAHRAGGRYQVRGPGLRWSLARIHLAVAAIAIVALLLPAWAMIGVNARDRAVAAAQLRAAAAAAVLAVSTDPATVDEALRDVLGDGAERVAVHGLAAPVGAGRATEDQLRTVSPPSTEDDQTV